MMMCAVIGASMQNAWGMEHGGDGEVRCGGRSCNPNPNQNPSAKSNLIPTEGGIGITQLVAAIEALNKNVTNRMDAMEKTIDTIEKRVKSMTEHSDHISLSTIKGKIDEVKNKVDSLEYKVGGIDSKVNLSTIKGKIDEVKNKVDSLEYKVGGIDSKVNTIGHKVDSIKTK
jgi:uncharacterized protein YoxC